MTRIIPLKEKEIEEAERMLGFSIPASLRDLYLHYGYGTLPSKNGYNTNLIMHPDTAVRFRKKEGEYRDYPDLDLYDEYRERYFVFFEANESAFFSIPIAPQENGIFYWDKKIADSIEEFVLKMLADDNYYLDLVK